MAGGDRYLRDLYDRFLADDRRDWEGPYFDAAQALAAIGEIDNETFWSIHSEIEASFARRDGRPAPPRPPWTTNCPPHIRMPWPIEPPQQKVLAALAQLPAPYGDGATNFLTTEGDQTFLICSGTGPAPWPDETSTSKPPELAVPPFRAVSDDRGTRYQLRRESWSTPDPDSPRPAGSSERRSHQPPTAPFAGSISKPTTAVSGPP